MKIKPTRCSKGGEGKAMGEWCQERVRGGEVKWGSGVSGEEIEKT
jgi:hypothetical protein